MNKIVLAAMLLNGFSQVNIQTQNNQLVTYLDEDIEKYDYVDPRMIVNNYKSSSDTKFEYRVDDKIWKEYTPGSDFEGRRIQFRILEKKLDNIIKITNRKCVFKNGDSFLENTKWEVKVYFRDLKYPITHIFDLNTDTCNVLNDRHFVFTHRWNEEDNHPGYHSGNYIEYKVENSNIIRRVNSTQFFSNNIIGKTFIIENFYNYIQDVTETTYVYNYKEVFLSKNFNIDMEGNIVKEFNLNSKLTKDELISSICDETKCLSVDKDIFINNLKVEYGTEFAMFESKTNNHKDIRLKFYFPEEKVEPDIPDQEIEIEEEGSFTQIKGDYIDNQVLVICSVSILLITFIVIYMYKRWNR